jgi:hypothetical protein
MLPQATVKKGLRPMLQPKGSTSKRTSVGHLACADGLATVASYMSSTEVISESFLPFLSSWPHHLSPLNADS